MAEIRRAAWRDSSHLPVWAPPQLMSSRALGAELFPPPLVNRRLSARVDDGNCTKAVIYLNLSKTNSVSVICLSLGKISLPVPDPECCVEHLTKASASEGLSPSPDGSISRAVKQLQHLIISHISFIIRYSKEVTLDFIIRKENSFLPMSVTLF